jgi:hypothetical protein
MRRSKLEPFDVKSDGCMWKTEESVRKESQQPPPYLIQDGKLQRCSICEHVFFPTDEPSPEALFAEHVRAHHKPKRIRKNEPSR